MTTDERVFELESTVRTWDDQYYHPIAEPLYDRAVSDMLRAMEVDPNETVLDAGCGPGVHSIRIARAGHRVCAADISERMLSHASERVAAAGLSDQVVFKREDLTNLSFASESFRHVFSWGVIIHIREVERALSELARVVQPGGTLGLYVINKTALDHGIETLARAASRKPLAGMQHLPLGDGVWYEMDGERLWVWRFDIPALSNHLAQYGLKLKYRRIGEFSEIQRRVRGMPRRALLRMNNLAYRARIPAWAGVGNLLVFTRRS
ncbi:MAG: class I SAM-dependent methyltransferase [Myxococcales bacterium]|nr:class I SAM-dependent methyltransferase [Myxococcales bacterium]MDH3485662.1 class I SAM-dependent methyltransferase [Myxococcales bacterium]